MATMLSSLVKRQTTGCRQSPSSRPRRLLSSMFTPPPQPSLPPPGEPVLVSRKLVEELHKRRPPKPRTTAPVDDKPWPLSVRIAGYVLGATVVPYCMAWFVASNETLREAIDPVAPQAVPWLRNWFGHEEENAVSYVERMEGGSELEIPKRLHNELSTKRRREEAALQVLIQEHPVPTRVRLYTEGGFNLGEIMDLPGTTLANTKTLLGVMMKDRSRTIDEDSVSHVTVEFTDVREPSKMEGDDVIVELHLPEYTSTPKLQINSMIKSTSIFSLWHAFPEFVIQQKQEQQKERQGEPKAYARTHDDIRLQQLEYEIEQLENHLKDRNTTRSFADIEEDLSVRRNELRSLKWKRRLSFFG